jgi:hypothetical protein
MLELAPGKFSITLISGESQLFFSVRRSLTLPINVTVASLDGFCLPAKKTGERNGD